MASHIDRSVHSDTTYACVHTYRIYIRRAGSRAAVCGIHPSILSAVTAIRAHVIDSGARVQSRPAGTKKGPLLHVPITKYKIIPNPNPNPNTKMTVNTIPKQMQYCNIVIAKHTPVHEVLGQKGHVLLAVIKPRVTHVRPFCVQSKVKRFNNAKVNDKYN